jgi:HEAT repeat protein
LSWMRKAAAPALIQSLQDSNADARKVVAGNLNITGTEAKGVVSSLIQALQDPNWWVREAVVYALAYINREPKQVIPVLIQNFQDSHPYVAKAIVYTLGKMGRESEQTIPVLIQSLQCSDSDARYMALRLLGNWGEKARDAVPALIRCLKYSYDERKAAVKALEKIDHNALRKEWLISYSLLPHVFAEGSIEAFVGVFFGIAWGWLFLSLTFAAFSFLTASRKIPCISVLLIVIFTFFSISWSRFAEAYELIRWVSEFRNLAILWGICVVLNCIVVVVRWKSLVNKTRTNQAT